MLRFRWSWSQSIIQGPVVQSVISLTSSLKVISLTDLADSIYNILIFYAEKMWVAFAMQKLLTFFSAKKIQHICVSLDVNFNDSLTNGVVSFEQLGPGLYSPFIYFIVDNDSVSGQGMPWTDLRTLRLIWAFPVRIFPKTSFRMALPI